MNAPAGRTDASQILVRILQRGQDSMPLEAARILLSLRLPEPDCERVNELAGLARAGQLSDEQRSELDDYEFVTAMLEVAQSKARLSLVTAHADQALSSVHE